jgi:hypothetical protein
MTVSPSTEVGICVDEVKTRVLKIITRRSQISPSPCHEAQKTSSSITPLILNLSGELHVPAVLPSMQGMWCQIISGLGGTQGRTGSLWRKEKCFAPTKIKSQVFQAVAMSLQGSEPF